MRVFLTGATGFIGHSLLDYLLARIDAEQICAAVRSLPADFPPVRIFRITDLVDDLDWSEALREVDVVIHTAARVHVMRDEVADPLSEFRTMNVHATLSLARQAAEAGVKRFVFLSSVKVNGESTEPGRPFTAEDRPAPVDPYGQSKWEAEQALFRLAEQRSMEVVIIRPPLVYGPGVGANFASLMRVVDRRLPLPFGLIRNQRSLVARSNLLDFIHVCMTHPAAANQVFLVSDGVDLSTGELCRKLSSSLGVRSRLLPVPTAALNTLAALVGRQAQAQRVLGSLQVDIEKNYRLLGWRPPISIDQAMQETARWYKENK